jgi:hypothetical protein
MADRRTLSAIGAGLAVGILGTAAALAVTADDSPDVSTTQAVATTTTTSQPSAWVDPEEARIGPSVVVADRLRREGSQLVLEYDVIGLTPVSGVDAHFETTSIPAAWVIETADAEVAARALSPGHNSVRFTTDAAPSEVTGAHIESYWVPAPLEIPLEVSPSDASWHEIVPGLRIRILQIVEQSGSFLVILEGGGEAPTFQGIGVEGIGRDWASSSRSMLGTVRWTLDYRGEALPDPMRMMVRGTSWVEIDTDVSVGLERVDRS